MQRTGKTGKAHELIVIEGIDGTGKTTVARVLAKAIRAKYVRTPSIVFNAARHRVDTDASLPTRFLFYLFTVAYASDLIRRELKERDVVCDRYVASTLAYHRALGVRMDWNIESLNLVKPEHVFLLHVSDERERLARISRRGQVIRNDQLLESSELRNRVVAEFRQLNFIEIDTAGRTPLQVVKIIRSRLTK